MRQYLLRPWENGGYRSKNGTIATCRPPLPALSGDDDPICSIDILCSDDNSDTDEMCQQPRSIDSAQHWCQQSIISSFGQICPTMNIVSDSSTATITCADNSSQQPSEIDIVRYGVPQHKSSGN